MSRQSKNARQRVLAKAFTDLHLKGERGPTPKGGAFQYAGVRIKKSDKSRKK